MNNVMKIGGHRAVIQFDPEIGTALTGFCRLGLRR